MTNTASEYHVLSWLECICFIGHYLQYPWPAATHIGQATLANAKTKAYPKSVAAPVR